MKRGGSDSGAQLLLLVAEHSSGTIVSRGDLIYYPCMIYNIGEAKKIFAKLVERALAGQEVILARRNDPVAKLVPVVARKRSTKNRRIKRV
jgi:prevent-host-death family protein